MNRAFIIREVCDRLQAAEAGESAGDLDLFTVLAVAHGNLGAATHKALLAFSAQASLEGIREALEKDLRAALVNAAAATIRVVELFDAGRLTIPALAADVSPPAEPATEVASPS